MPLFCRRATAIIAVSAATRQDLVTHYGLNAAKIRVIHEAAAPHFRPPFAEDIARVRQRYDLPDRFLIHLGTIEPRKNLDRLVDALHIVRRTEPDLGLILVGSRGWLTEGFFRRLASEGLENIVRPLGWVPDGDLPAVIGAAALGVQPSLYEGFGLPILEQMGCDQVVAASNRGSHPEVGGEAAAYFDPDDTEEMAATIGRLLANRDEYAARVALGRVQAARFSWARAAGETAQLYDELLAEDE
jgi:glycosyltransferase involved in cell wall biosynthesis